MDGPGAEGEAAGPLWRRLAWFLALWAGGVASVGAVAFVLRWWLNG
jgi:hypothetical protein